MHDKITHRHDTLNKKSCVQNRSRFHIGEVQAGHASDGHVNHPKFENYLGARTKLNPWGFREENGNLMQWQ